MTDARRERWGIAWISIHEGRFAPLYCVSFQKGQATETGACTLALSCVGRVRALARGACQAEVLFTYIMHEPVPLDHQQQEMNIRQLLAIRLVGES